MQDLVKYENPIFKFFAAVPYIAADELTGDELRLYMKYIQWATWQQSGQPCQMGVRTIRELLGYGKNTVTALKQGLLTKGYIYIKGSKSNQTPDVVTLRFDVWVRNWNAYASNEERRSIARSIMNSDGFDDEVDAYLREHTDIAMSLFQQLIDEGDKDALALVEKLGVTQSGTLRPSTSDRVSPDEGHGVPEAGTLYIEKKNKNTLVAESATDESASPVEEQTLKQLHYHGNSLPDAHDLQQNNYVRETPTSIEVRAIVAYVQWQDKFGATLTKRQIERLTMPFVFKEDPRHHMPAPALLFGTEPLFREYIDDCVKWTKQMNRNIISFKTLVGMIANYDRKTPGMEGWLLWKEQNAKPSTVKASSGPEMTQEELERQIREAQNHY